MINVLRSTGRKMLENPGILAFHQASCKSVFLATCLPHKGRRASNLRELFSCLSRKHTGLLSVICEETKRNMPTEDTYNFKPVEQGPIYSYLFKVVFNITHTFTFTKEKVFAKENHV